MVFDWCQLRVLTGLNDIVDKNFDLIYKRGETKMIAI